MLEGERRCVCQSGWRGEPGWRGEEEDKQGGITQEGEEGILQDDSLYFIHPKLYFCAEIETYREICPPWLHYFFLEKQY